MRRYPRQLALLLAAFVLGGCASTPPDDPADPLENVNRGIYKFNTVADKYVLRPVAKGYDFVTPGFMRTGIGNFFSNLFYPTVVVNDLLQLKLKQGGADVWRFVMNTTFGVAGLVDVATPLGLERHDEDFGQTLGYWGVGPGWYLMLPLLGPFDNRDLVGGGVDTYTNPLFYVENQTVSWGLGAVNVVDARAGLLGADQVVEQQLDPYVFVRSIYLQNRLNKVYDGNPPKEDFDFGDEEEKKDEAPSPPAK